jgi:hypothetical protein
MGAYYFPGGNRCHKKWLGLTSVYNNVRSYPLWESKRISTKKEKGGHLTVN